MENQTSHLSYTCHYHEIATASIQHSRHYGTNQTAPHPFPSGPYYRLVPVAIELGELPPLLGIAPVRGHEVLHVVDVHVVGLEGPVQLVDELPQAHGLVVGGHPRLTLELARGQHQPAALLGHRSS